MFRPQLRSSARPSCRPVRFALLALGIGLLLGPAILHHRAAAQPPAAQSPDSPAAKPPDAQSQAESPNQPRYTTDRIRGRVVWLAEAVQKLHGVETDPDFAQSLVALQSADGTLTPLLKDARGRGFMMDKRLRNRPLELLVRRYPGLPLVQVITVYTVHDDQKFELDYWCDICAISMYELKECECCQGPIRLRERAVGSNHD